MRRTFHDSRRRQRGAVLVEAAVVIPTFILLLGGMLFLHHVVREQQRVAKDARNRAWTYAMASCQGSGNGVPQPDFTSTMPGAPGSGTLQDNLGKSSATASSTVSVSSDGSGVPPLAASDGFFEFSQTVSSHTVVFCNDQSQPGDIGGVFHWLLDNIQGLIGGVP
jgi:TadE-like protein